MLTRTYEDHFVLALGMIGALSPALSSFAPQAGFLGLPLITLLPGFLLLRFIAPADRLVRIAAAFPMSLVISSLYGLVLVLLGELNQYAVCLGLFSLSVSFMLLSRRMSIDRRPLRQIMSRKNALVLSVSIFTAILSNIGLLILFQFPVGYDAWSFMSATQLTATGGSLPFWLDGAVGQVNFYPPLFQIFMAEILQAVHASVISVFWAAPLFLAGFFVMSVFALAKVAFGRLDVALMASLLASTIGSTQFEGMDRTFPVSLAMIAFPTFIMTTTLAAQSRLRISGWLIAAGTSAFLWLCFPPAGLLGVLTTFVDSIIRMGSRQKLFSWLKISVVGVISTIGYYVPFVATYGIPRNDFFAPWLTYYQSATIFSTSFVIALFNYTGLIIPAGLAVGEYAYVRFSKPRLNYPIVVTWTLVSVLFILVWDVALQGRLQFLGSVRFIPFLATGFATLSAWPIASIHSRLRTSSNRFISRQKLLSIIIVCVVFSSVVVTANANYHEWLPPTYVPVGSAYYNAANWFRDNAPNGATVLTLDPLAQSVLVDVVGRGVHVTFDTTTYAFWNPPAVITAYRDTVTMLFSNNSSQSYLIAKYNVSYVMITDSTIQYLAQIENMTATKVEAVLSAEFSNSTKFTWAYSDLSAYQTQAFSEWAVLQHLPTGAKLQTQWNQLPYWEKSSFQDWLADSGFNIYQLTWDQVLAAMQSLGPPDLTSIASSLSVSALPLPVIYKVNP